MALERSVIFIEQKSDDKSVEFTHLSYPDKGWKEDDDKPGSFEKVIYLGKCKIDGDMFACYDKAGNISIYKGHLNSGRY